ncbi:MAG: YabP/YqfC family sporulation protein [Clostridium sp.]|nr:YabP/YqfC family sporulation protein [Clostridium sp.]MBS6914853.1 YabP/YqfC family sporulation protein [Clostridium sp.]
MRMGRGGACLFDRQKRAVVSALNLPEDVMLGDMFLSFTGNRGVLIENYRNIILYTDTALRLQGKNGRLTIEGTCLTIRYYDKEQLFLSGLIRSAVFEPL